MTTGDSLKLKNQLCFPLYAAARKVTGLYTPFLKPLGLTYTQYIVFLVLWEQDGIPVSRIGEELMLDNGTLTPLLKKLEQEGYVVRKRSAEDERRVLVTLTEKGRKLQKKAEEIPSKVGNCLFIEPESARQLHGLLYEILKQ